MLYYLIAAWACPLYGGFVVRCYIVALKWSGLCDSLCSSMDGMYLLLQDKRTALMLASKVGDVSLVEALLDKKWGAVVDSQDKVSSTKAVRCLLLMWCV